MTGKSQRIDHNNGDDVQMKDEKLDEAKKETGEENQSEEIGSEPCVAPGAIQSDESGIPEYCPNEDDKAAREESEHEDAVGTQKRESEEADISEAPAKKRRVASINSRKLIYKVISRVKQRKFDENLIEKTEMIVNRKSCDFTNIECHLKTDVTKVIHAIMEMEEHSSHESEESEQQRWQKLYGDMTFVDDVHGGKLLKRDKVIEARKIEMEYFWKMGVFEKVHRSKARGYKVITTRWVDTNKGVGNEDNYRSRLVGRKLNLDKRK